MSQIHKKLHKLTLSQMTLTNSGLQSVQEHDRRWFVVRVTLDCKYVKLEVTK